MMAWDPVKSLFWIIANVVVLLTRTAAGVFKVVRGCPEKESSSKQDLKKAGIVGRRQEWLKKILHLDPLCLGWIAPDSDWMLLADFMLKQHGYSCLIFVYFQSQKKSSFWLHQKHSPSIFGGFMDKFLSIFGV